MEKIIIVGGVAAGATAAAKIRRISPDAEITMLEAGADISFANCGLPYFISGDIESRSKLILQSPESFKSQYNVNVYTHTLVTSIDRNIKKVLATNSVNGDQKSFDYTKLILAQGGRPVRPSIPGAGMDHVFTLWTLEDMDKITHHLQERKPVSAAIVGGGFIGLEMAESLVKRGLKVHVIEMLPHVMGGLDPEIAGFIEKDMLKHGVEIHKSTGVTEIFADGILLGNGKRINTGMVLLSTGVKPTLQLAVEAGLKTGESGGLSVNSKLQTSDPDIFAAGDMIEIEQRVSGKKVRIPLAGPANRQGRIVAENVMGGNHEYKGALGTSIVRVFNAIAGSTGLSMNQALSAGFDAQSVTVHKEHHTAYYPGAEQVTVKLVYDRKTGTILGGQTAGFKGADKRLDVIAMAAASKQTVHDLADTDFSYAPPIGTPNDALNMAAYAAENRMSGYSPAFTAAELDSYLESRKVTFLDVRDLFAFQKDHIEGAVHIPLELLSGRISELPSGRIILVYDETGKKGHQALRMLKGAGHEVINISGGYISIQHHDIAVGFKNLKFASASADSHLPSASADGSLENNSSEKPLIIDVRTVREFAGGYYPGAVNIPLDELMRHVAEFGSPDREITVYCASGARSAYAKQMLEQHGFSNVTNGGGIMQMMMGKR
jgi:NADPH-dependent 2,4-dienoyl-CoA reductase/sulfur reductase-like enzyme/rhodanese-related sulfurtransferase